MVRKLPERKWHLNQTLKKMDRILMDGEGKREGEDIVGREGHSGRKVQSAFRGAASGLVNNCVQRNWTTVDRTV